jgi:glycosyltransferase involved in cell wall biosynthesis
VNSSRRRWAFVDWAKDCSRSDAYVRELGMDLIRHHKNRGGVGATAYKYAWQLLRTTRDLVRQRPTRVMCMSPSPLTALPVWLYCKATGAEFVIDAHTGAFIGAPWDRMPWIQPFFTRRALATIVTNDRLAELVRAHGGRPIVVPDVPTERVAGEAVELGDGFHVVFVASWGLDEPLAEVIATARALPDVVFHVTGKPKPHHADIVRDLPANVRLTGFLSRARYLATIAAADVVLALTTRDHTMQRAAYEAVYLGTPVVISDWPILRENFEGAAVFTANDPESLTRALASARALAPSLRSGASHLRQAKLARWENNRRALQALLGAAERNDIGSV